MAFREKSPVLRKNNKIIPELPSKIPGKLVSAKRVNTGKLNLHMVSSTPLNPAKKAKFFDESNQLGSPIKNSGSSSDNPDNIIIPPTTEITNKKTMLIEDQTVDASPFPLVSKLAVKKMTICASDEDTDDDIFERSPSKITKKKNKLMLDLYDEVNSSDSEVHIKQQTKAIIESPRKFNSDEEIIKDVVVAKKSTKNLKEKLVDAKPQKNVKATKKSVKSSDEEKENIFKETNETQNKAKKQAAEKNTKLKPTDNKDKANLDVSPKQKKLNENTVQKIRLTKNKNENNDINNRTEGNKLLDSRARKSSRSCSANIPYWMAPFTTTVTDTTENTTVAAKRKRSENNDNDTIMSVKAIKRPNSVPVTVTKRKQPKIDEKKIDNTVTLNRSKSKLKSELNNKNTKKETNEANVKNVTINKSKNTLKSDSEKMDVIKETIEENVKNVTLNQSKSKVKTNKTEKKSTLIDEAPETGKNLNKSKTKEVEKKVKESQKNVPKSNEKDQDVQLKDVQDNKKRRYSGELLDKESKEEKNKVENIAAKLRKSLSPKKNSRDSLHQSVVVNQMFGPESQVFEPENQIFEPENQIFDPETEEINNETLRRLVEESIVKSQNISKRSNTNRSHKETNEVLSPSRISKRIFERTPKDTNKIEYTPGVALKQNKSEEKSTHKRKASNSENKANKKMKNRSLRSNSFNIKKSNRNEEIEKNDLETEDLSDLDRSDDNQQRRSTRQRPVVAEKSGKSRSKTGLVGKHSTNKSSKQVNFNPQSNTIDTDSLSSFENPSKVSCKASYNFNTMTKPSRDDRYPRTLFYDECINGPRRSYRKPRYIDNDSMLYDSDDSWISEEFYVPKTRRLKYRIRRDYKKRKVDKAGFLNFKEKALAVQVPVVRQTLTEIVYRGKTLKMECFGNFPKSMTKINEHSSLRGTCFMNDMFASGMMEITLGTIKKCNASNNHTYFIVLDGLAEIGIGDSVKIMRIGDCCIVPKHTFYYIANASSDVNLLLNFLKISL